MMNNTLQTLDQQYLAQTYARFPLVLSHAKGCEVWDFNGNSYLDFTSGIGTNCLGWGNEQWLNAVIHQATHLAHTSNLYFTEPSTLLAEKLSQASGLKRAFFCNSGAEANEGAIKTARKYSQEKYGDQRYTILTLENSFHGRTITTLSATGQATFHQHFSPFTQGFDYLPINDISALHQRLQQNDVCAIMLEVIQGEGGIVPLQADYLNAIQQYCQKQDILLIIDEIQTGIGRTGELFAYQHFGLKPDLVTLAKGLGGGLPIGAVLFGEKCQHTLGKGDHGSTFGGNPICCAAANAVLSQLTPEFLNEIKQKGKHFRHQLAQLPKVKSVTGLGLMIGIEFEENLKASEIVAKGIQQGVLFLTAKQKLRLLPPLIIDNEQITRGITVLRKILENIA